MKLFLTISIMIVSLLCNARECMNAKLEDDSVRFSIEKTWDIAEVTADFPVRFCLLTEDQNQFIAYYDKQRRMTIASRKLDSNTWQYQVLPSKVGWDSHNYITMAVDSKGYLHVSGNMHVDTLIYFRSEEPGDIKTLERSSMTGTDEDRTTYPVFLSDRDGHLVFKYRDGGSGNGNDIYNIYDANTRQWSRLLDTPLLDGEGNYNAYAIGPVKGPDGYFHLVWVWRDTPDCATNHHLSYARSMDLINWESSFGVKVELPVRLNNQALWVDPIPSGGGIINGCQKLIFDSDYRPIISYHKSDADGNMQIYAARPENGKWVKHQLTDWNTPIEFSGRGSMGFIGIRISAFSKIEPGLLTMTYLHRDYGEGRLFVEEKMLCPLELEINVERAYPKELDQVQSDFKGMQIQRVEDSGSSGSDDVRYILQWETLGKNNDLPRIPPLPQPGMLRLYKIKTH